MADYYDSKLIFRYVHPTTGDIESLTDVGTHSDDYTSPGTDTYEFTVSKTEIIWTKTGHAPGYVSPPKTIFSVTSKFPDYEISYVASDSSGSNKRYPPASGKATYTVSITRNIACGMAWIYIFMKSKSPADSITLDRTSITLSVNETAAITATASGSVTWTTSDSSVATVNNGVVTANKAGTATITATCGTATATCTVTVKQEEGVVTEELLGTWVFNETVPVRPDVYDFNLSFTSNGIYYNELDIVDEMYYKSRSDPSQPPERSDVAYAYTGGWENQAYRTIIITDISTLKNRDEFTSWLRANATKQESEGSTMTYKFRINGKFALLNGIEKGTLTFQGITYQWDNTGALAEKPKLATPVIELATPQENNFEYQISSFDAVQSTNVSVSITDNDGTTTSEYTSATGKISRKFSGACTMNVAYTTNDNNPDLVVRKNNQAVEPTNISISNNDVIDISWYSSCLTGDTMIMLADGSEKRIDSLSENDLILGYNPDTLELVPQKIVMCDAKSEKYGDSFTRYTFSDGKYVDIVHRHAFYNADVGIMACLDGWELGMHARTKDGAMPELVKVETFEGKVRHYTIFTEYENYFSNGLLTGNRFTERLYFDLYKEANT